MADFDFKVGFDASEVVSGAAKTDQSLSGMESQFEKLIAVTERIAGSLGAGLSSAGDGAASTGEKIASGLNGGFDKVQHKVDETKTHSEGFFSSLTEKFGELGGVIAGGAIFSGAAFGLESLFSAGEKRLKSLEDYSIALRQSGIEEQNLGAAEKAGAGIVDELSEKYAKNKEELRSVITQVTGLGGISVDQSKKVAEIGLAFEQVGVPARSFKQLLAGAGGPESVAALETIKTKFPAIATAMEGAGTAGQKVDAIFKGISPTLEGMKEAADGPLGSLERIKNSSSELTGALGETIIEAVQPFTGALLGIANVLKDDVIPIITSVSRFIAENKTAIEIAAGGYIALRAAMAIQEGGGFITTLTNIGKSALDAGKSIVEKLVPGIFAKTAAEGADAAAKTTETVAEVGNTIATEANIAAKEAGAVAEEGMAAASEGLGVALDAALGPIGLVIAAVTIGATAFAIFSKSTKDLGTAAKDADDALGEFNKASSDQTAIDSKAISLDKLASRYDDLSAIGNRNAAQQKELDDITQQLSASIPEATDKFDAYSGKISVATDKVREFNTEQQKVAAHDKQEALLNLEEKTKDLVNSFNAAQESVTKLRGEQALLQSNINIVPHGLLDGLLSQVGLGKSIKDKQAENTAEIVKQTAELNKHRPELAKIVEALAQQGASTDDIAKKTGLNVIQVQQLEASNKLAAVAVEEHRKSAAGLADEYNKAKDAASKITTENLAAAAQQERSVLVIDASIRDAQAQGDQERVVSLQKMKSELVAQINLNQQNAQNNQAVTDQLEKSNAIEKEILEGNRHAVELQNERNKLTADELEITLRKNDAHKLSILDEDVLTAQKLKSITADEHALALTHEYQNTQLQKLQYAEKETAFELEKEKLLEKQNDQLKKLADEYIKIQEANIKSETDLLTSLSQFGGSNIDAQLKLFSLTADGVRIKTGLLVDELGRHKGFEDFNAQVQAIVDSTGKLREGVDLGKASFDLVSNAVEKNNASYASNVSLLKQITSGTISFIDAATKIKEFVQIDPLVQAFTSLQKIELDKIKFFQDQLKKESDLAALREQVAVRLFGFDPQQTQKSLDLLKSSFDKEADIINKSTLSDSAKEQARLSATKKYYEESDKLVEAGIKHQKKINDSSVSADPFISDLSKKVQLIANAYDEETALLEEQHKRGLLSEEDYNNKIVEARTKSLKELKTLQQESIKDISETFGAGFSAAFGVINKSLFDPLDKQLNAANNAFGAFASGAIKHLAELGEQALANLVINSIGSAIATAATVGAMNTIRDASQEAAFNVAVATLGVAGIIGFGSLSANLAAFKGIEKNDSGSVVSSPTLALIGENFQDELILPMKTAKEFLAEAVGGSFGGNNGITKDDLIDALNIAFQNNPVRGEISGYNIALVNNGQSRRLARRGA